MASSIQPRMLHCNQQNPALASSGCLMQHTQRVRQPSRRQALSGQDTNKKLAVQPSLPPPPLPPPAVPAPSKASLPLPRLNPRRHPRPRAPSLCPAQHAGLQPRQRGVLRPADNEHDHLRITYRTAAAGEGAAGPAVSAGQGAGCVWGGGRWSGRQGSKRPQV